MYFRKIRVGQGIDVHQLKEGNDFWLGGIQIPHSKGAVGHSDADVLIHAICDALLGAANKRDIGFHFPDNSAEFKGIDSKILLKRVAEIIKEDDWTIGNIDATILLERPKIATYISKMQTALSETMGISPDQVSIKATTNEKLGFLGREEGIQASAVVLIYC